MSKILQKAIDSARAIQHKPGEARVYAIVTDRKGRVLSENSNAYGKSHPKQKEYNSAAGVNKVRCNLHAELRVLLQAAKVNPKDCTITVARVGANGQTLPAYPCPSCRLAIKESGFIKSIQHTV